MMDAPPPNGPLDVEVRPRTNSADDVSLLDVVNLLLRRRRLILGLGLLTGVLAAVAVSFEERSWTSSASFMPHSSGGQPSGLMTLAGQFGFDVSGGSSQQSPEFYAALVESRTILGEVALQRYPVPSSVRDSATLGRIIGFEDIPPDLERARTIDWLRDQVEVAPARETGVVHVLVTTPWPFISAGIAAAVIDRVNDFNLRTRRSEAAAERQFIEDRLEEARSSLGTVEGSLESFLQANRRIDNSPQLMFERDRLERRVLMQEELYTQLAKAYEEARISEVRNTAVITVLEPPEVPLTPNARNLPFRAGIGLGLGILLGVFLALVRGYTTRVQRQGSEEFQEFSELWTQTWAGLKPFRRPSRSVSDAVS